MKRTVWKYSLDLVDGRQFFEIPHGAQSLMVAKQGEHVCLWMDVDAEAPRDTWAFIICGTGHAVPEIALHLGSCMDGEFVWHLYEVPA